MRKRRLRPYPDLRTWRFFAKLNQTEAAAVLGISQQYYSRVERGAGRLSEQKAKDVMERTGVPLEALIDVA